MTPNIFTRLVRSGKDTCLYRAVLARMIEEVAGFPPNANDVDEVMTAIGEVDVNDIYSFMSKARPVATSFGRKIGFGKSLNNILERHFDNLFLQGRKM